MCSNPANTRQVLKSQLLENLKPKLGKIQKRFQLVQIGDKQFQKGLSLHQVAATLTVTTAKKPDRPRRFLIWKSSFVYFVPNELSSI